jgi:hypothetical protein
MCRSKGIESVIEKFSLDIAELEKLNVRTLQDLEAFVSTKPNQTDAKLPIFFEPRYTQFDKKEEYELYKELILKLYREKDPKKMSPKLTGIIERLRESEQEEDVKKQQKRSAPARIQLAPLGKELPRARYVPQTRQVQPITRAPKPIQSRQKQYAPKPKPVPQKPEPAATLNKFSTSRKPITMVKEKPEGKVILSYADIATAVRDAGVKKDAVVPYVKSIYINAGVTEKLARTRAYNFQNKLKHSTLSAIAKGGDYNNVVKYLPKGAQETVDSKVEVKPGKKVKTTKVEAKAEGSLDDKFDACAEGLEILDHLPLTDAERRDVDKTVSSAYDTVGMKIQQYMTKYAKGLETNIAYQQQELEKTKSLLALTDTYLKKK